MTSTLILAATIFAVSAMICIAASRAWHAWLKLKKLELAAASAPSEADREAAEAAEDDIGVRIELAAVRERLKKLEAIASGVEL
jgi:hypothetical protein